MQMKKPKKFCKNPECEQEILEYKSLKREYCSDYCRSHYGYARRLEENKEFIAHAKGLSENYKLLKMHKNAGILEESFDKYEKLGFNINYLPSFKIYKIKGFNKLTYQIKDIVFSVDKEKKLIIIY